MFYHPKSLNNRIIIISCQSTSELISMSGETLILFTFGKRHVFVKPQRDALVIYST